MGKKSKLFALKLAMSLVVIMTLSLPAWACYSTQLCLNNEVEITTIIGFQNQTWCYVVKNINFTKPMGLSPFRVDFLGVNPVGLVSNITSPPNYVSGIYTLPPAPPCVFWLATTEPGIAPGTEKKFSFQTNNITGVVAQDVPSNIFAASLVPASLPAGRATAAFVNALSSPTITAVEGLVGVQQFGSSDWLPASVGMTLSLGDKVRTDSNGRCTLEYDDGSTMNMEPNSWLRNAGNVQVTTQVTLFLDTIGKIFHKWQYNLNRKLQVRTPAACACVRGTEFSMEYNAGTTIVSVQSGEVDVADLSGGKLGAITIVPAGTTIRIPSGALPFLVPLLMGD
jgi:hypothetical protein